MLSLRPLLLATLVFTCGLRAADRNWAAFSGDSGGTHYSSLTAITAQNVKSLAPAWEYHAGDASRENRSQIQCNPLVIDGVLYGTSPTLKLFALDAATGAERWRFDPFPRRKGGGGGGPNRG